MLSKGWNQIIKVSKPKSSPISSIDDLGIEEEKKNFKSQLNHQNKALTKSK